MAYKDIVPVGTGLIICATSFALGVIYANLPYDYFTLWTFDPNGIERSVAHYSAWANAPMRVHHILHVVALLGLSGCFIKLYKPHPEIKYFEYGTLGLMMVAIVIYLTNLRIGVNSALTGLWGDVDMATGINVMAASQFMMVVALFGVLILQGGLYYAEWYDKKIQHEFLEKERARADARAEAAADAETKEVPSATASGAEPKKTEVKKTEKKKSKKKA
ncbi:hypothetical protein E0198_000911 [Clavispora lusitaniae]|nr:hypothetical protein E0198_000911 [Clavispora lusitaniae]